MTRVERKSPTLGQKPPSGAVVLLPFEEGQPTNLDNLANKHWICEPDGSILVNKATTRACGSSAVISCTSSFACRSCPAARGQARGNSGVYQHGRYEIQVLDSFGLVANAGDCGAIYSKKAPGHECLAAAGQWQTSTSNSRRRVRRCRSADQGSGDLGGPQRREDPRRDRGQGRHRRYLGQPAKTGPIRLQDHGGDPTHSAISGSWKRSEENR